ncbi:carboxylesterase/lipase family protein [Novosphingobium piscinae]|uniref:Carboxylic ester hydrolase n=1 Tax=Novosphingobium piscinae TaxID=1507448 RepID=A0A7X1FV43_9SPHN|nr:carboxylesterase family protein [Novosphingobium piscinae]MBC2667538.1 carboxylesterase/lipase family protein [Novosphingobium piscinae]
MSAAKPAAAGGLTRRAMLATGLATVAADRVGAAPSDRALPVRRFLGIRYAEAERFAAPRLVADRAPLGRFGPACPQGGGAYQPQDEACQYLNVWAPADAPRGGLPVLAYIHGGAYSNGSVTDPLNDGARLAAAGVVVVTINHRLNALGYLYLPDRFPDSGNAGQLDLVCALRWIQARIADFGGDPGNVTLFGQSGGGAKIATLMAMPAARGLFHKAITMSGQQVTASGPLHARQRAEAVLGRLGGDPATVPAAALIAALAVPDPILGGGVYMGPVLDMRHLSRHPFWPEPAPEGRTIPMLLGNTVAETRAFFPPGHPRLQGLDWDNLAMRVGPEMKVDIDPAWTVAQFRARYPADPPEALFHRVVTAARSWRGQVEEADARARAGLRRTWVYQLDFAQAKHTDDIGLAFGTTATEGPARAAMSARLMAAFVRFARRGDPGWAPYTLPRRETMVFDTVSRVVNDPRQWERELFARVPYIQPGS